MCTDAEAASYTSAAPVTPRGVIRGCIWVRAAAQQHSAFRERSTEIFRRDGRQQSRSRTRQGRIKQGQPQTFLARRLIAFLIFLPLCWSWSRIRNFFAVTFVAQAT